MNNSHHSQQKSLSPANLVSTNISKKNFPIVGIGASAGGLEALEIFLAHLPPDCGLAVVIVQHLDPHHKDALAEILQRSTAMRVQQIEDLMKAEPNHIYIIPPNYDLSILHGVLHLQKIATQGLHFPIDSFLCSLANDQQGWAIGVILSGMGSDGTLGLRAIKEKSGLTVVQSPDSAKFDSMPVSAINAGLADVVAATEELPAKILTYLQHFSTLSVQSYFGSQNSDKTAIEQIVMLLRTKIGHDFSLYKKSTIYRRIERRMGMHQLSEMKDYVQYLHKNPQELELLFKELLIGVTCFFRDPQVWEQLKTEVIPALLAKYPSGGTLRAWSVGCSTGEEAYSLAMVFHEALEQVKPSANYLLQIFATDLDKDAIEQARTGIYPLNIAKDCSEKRLQRFFIQEEGRYRVRKDIREMVIFATQNLVMDAPFTKLDLLICRNLLIYLEAELQKKLLPLFHYSLNPNGILVLDPSGGVGQASELFTQLPGKNRIYQRQNKILPKTPLEFPTLFFTQTYPTTTSMLPSTSQKTPNLQELIQALLLQHYSPPAVLTTDKGDIIYIHGKTGKYLEPAAGKANMNIFAMARDGLGSVLTVTFFKALREKSILTQKNVEIGTNGGKQLVDVTVHVLDESSSLAGMVLIVFNDVKQTQLKKPSHKTQKESVPINQLLTLEQELQQSREELQTVHEEMQISQEELKSANEELQSTNEELQSTNEELTTSKEEMQSMNEELQTVNNELQAKIEELSQSSDDMKNLLNSTEIATLFLDDKLQIRRFTSKTTQIIKLISSDVGRPITDIATELNYPSMEEDLRTVLQSLIFHECQVSSRSGQWFSVRIMPYRTQDNRIEGVVMMFLDITAAKIIEESVREVVQLLNNYTSQNTTEFKTVNNLEKLLESTKSILENALPR